MTSIDNIATDLQLFHQNILDTYISTKSATEKWLNIATFIHDNNNVIVNAFSVIKKNDDRNETEMDYLTEFEQLQNQIKEESDPLRKCSFIILSLHKMIYDLMTTEGNYYFSLIGKEEMSILKDDIIYYVNLSIKTEQNIYFHAYILLYALESLFNRHFYVGVDFEYTNKKIQLAQLNFEHNKSFKSIIMMVSPSELEQVMMENFVNLIICNKFIKKILHGSDSLDIPYVYNHMLETDADKIIKFTKALIDTRFLCEYYKLNKIGVSDNRCSIYDQDPGRSAIYYFKVVSEEQQNKLSELLESMPAPHDIQWNIHKMPKSQVLYAQYDVIFLKYFYYRMIYVATDDETSDIGKKATIELYKNVLTELTQFVYLENNNITFLRSKCKEEVDVVNNYFVRKPNGILKMIDIYNLISTNLSTSNPSVDIDKILKVNHFKSTVTILIKRIVYGHISQKCRIYKDKATMWTDKLSNQLILDFLKQMEFNYLFSMFKELDKLLESKVKLTCS
ncbi:hypothetical protein QJ857_gp1084 [Tupanvirus soda lake]|uniref:Exonuclease n=2 Tax=Tupanvirus TaxID=2094720 RepID=A0A6N1NLE0_9VIRU|nr:hypothetical protein QJ857_gp1084 [Tupanvirus soda lake]QKU34970.1 hypothetical protein [Tupanvirus soda lake]